ncbi:glycosyltransferase [Sulfurovum sp. TSL1]|uniref:glycosyltransferase n=1 Tax=Sulfurovum sp. TSL1 TaxID=2826994 RepID=UPI001CC52D66|nr:glycosyltransferase [Sulfurovum sp. TSL1]GIT99334.1 glycosyl transferase family 1 [Sulfurovum sp. TSL1]
MNHKKIKILYISGTPRGGIATVVSGLQRYFEKNKIFESNSIVLNTKLGKGKIHLACEFIKLIFLFKRYKKFTDIIHFHGAWTPHILLSKFVKGIPTVISPHGALHKESLKKSRLKKNIAKFLYMKKSYTSADCLHALTKQEAKDIVDYGIQNIPIAIIPNGIDFEEKLYIDKKKKEELLVLSRGRRVILSLSRLDPSKGIDLLIEAFYRLNNKNCDYVLFIAGEGNIMYTNSLLEKVKQFNLQDKVFFLGDVREKVKNTVYDVADIFVLPSFNEGFGLTVLEAFRQKIPVITTNTTPFDQVEKLGCGWYISPNVSALEEALEQSAEMSKEKLEVMGEKGHEWSKSNFSMEVVNKKYELLYHWLIGNPDKPNFII